MSQPMPEQIARLPKWARAHIDMLERKLHETRLYAERLKDERQDKYDGSVYYGTDSPSLRMNTKVLLPEMSAIRFRLGDSWRDEIHVRRDGTSIEVMGGDAIKVLPRSSNVVYISAN